MTNHMRRRIAAAALAAGALLLAACGSSSTTSTTTSTAAAASAPAAGKATISTTKTSAGTYLTGASGRAVYLWVADPAGRSVCTGACAQVWPPVIASGAPTAAGGALAADVGTITRSDGSKQVTYKGHPLYYFSADSAAGSTQGQGSDGFGAKWWLVAPSGSALTTTPTGAGTGSGSGSNRSIY